MAGSFDCGGNCLSASGDSHTGPSKEPDASSYFIRVLRSLRGHGARLVKAIDQALRILIPVSGARPAAAAIFQASSKRDGSVRA